MIKRCTAAVFLFCITAVFLAGCGDGPKEKVIGVWKSEQPSLLSGLPEFLIIEEKKLSDGRGQVLDIVIEDKDGKVVIRKAGLDEPLFIITISDDKNSIIVDDNSVDNPAKFLASSKEEMQDILTPSPSKIIGYWVRPVDVDGIMIYSVLEIGKDYIRYNGTEDKVEIQSGEGQYTFAGSQISKYRSPSRMKRLLWPAARLAARLSLEDLTRRKPRPSWPNAPTQPTH